MKRSNKKNISKARLFSGTSGLVVPEANKRLFPVAFQDKSRLTYYSSLFNSIEINSSFKKLPMPRTIEKWIASVPDDFQFTFKCSNVITHNKGLVFDVKDIHRLFEVIHSAGKKKGCLLVQFPGKLTISFAEQFANLIKEIRQADLKREWKIAIEFRHSSWYTKNIYQLLARYKAALVYHDMPSSSPPLPDAVSAFIYLRFHGPEKGYRGSYTDEFLMAHAENIKGWLAEGKHVYVYFNNTLGSAAINLATLNRFVHAT